MAFVYGFDETDEASLGALFFSKLRAMLAARGGAAPLPKGGILGRFFRHVMAKKAAATKPLPKPVKKVVVAKPLPKPAEKVVKKMTGSMIPAVPKPEKEIAIKIGLHKKIPVSEFIKRLEKMGPDKTVKISPFRTITVKELIGKLRLATAASSVPKSFLGHKLLEGRVITRLEGDDWDWYDE